MPGKYVTVLGDGNSDGDRRPMPPVPPHGDPRVCAWWWINPDAHMAISASSPLWQATGQQVRPFQGEVQQHLCYPWVSSTVAVKGMGFSSPTPSGEAQPRQRIVRLGGCDLVHRRSARRSQMVAARISPNYSGQHKASLSLRGTVE